MYIEVVDMFSEYVLQNLDVETWLPSLYKQFAWITILSTVINRGVYLKYSKRRIYPNTFTMLIGGSGTGKGVVIDDVVRSMLYDVDPDLLLPEYVTPESLLKYLSNRSRGIIATDEATTLLSTKEYMRDMSDYLTYLYNAHKEYIQIHRVKKSRTYMIERPYLNILIGVQPRVIKRIVNYYDIASGFLQRFYIVYAEPEKEKEVEEDKDSWDRATEIAKDIYNHFSRLNEPVKMVLSSRAIHEVRRYIDRVEREYEDEIFSRWRDLVLKLSIIMQVDKHSDNIGDVDIEELEVIDIDVVKRAIRLMREIEGSARKVVEIVTSTRDGEIANRIKQVIDRLIEKGKYIEDNGRRYVLRRDIMMYVRMRIDALEPYLKMLQEMDVLGERKLIGKKIAYEVRR